MNEGRKDDTGKLRYDLIPPEVQMAMAAVLGVGTAKYEARDWEKGRDWSATYAALQRHLTAWWAGETYDPETGMSHLWHAQSRLGFLIAYESRGVGKDDRWTCETFAPVTLAAEAQMREAIRRIREARHPQSTQEMLRHALAANVLNDPVT